MNRLSDTAIEIVNELHTERLDYDSEYLPLINALDRLAAYEDTGLEPEEVERYAKAEKEGRYIVLKEARSAGVHRLEEIARADIEGRLVVLPCKVGEELWIKRNGKIQCETVDRIAVDQTDKDDDLFISIYTMSVSVLSEDIGRLVFLTREDAEKALEGMMEEDP